MSLFNFVSYKNKNPLHSLVYLSILISTLFTIYIYFKKDIIKIPEKYFSLSKLITLYANRWFHLFILILIRLYVIIVPYNFYYDLLVIIFFIIRGIVFHILYKDECYFTIVEKKILNPSYMPGSDFYYEPFILLLFPEMNNRKLIATIIHRGTHFIILSIILYRFSKTLLQKFIF